MGCRILEGKDNGAVFYCSTSGWAFGPLMESIEEAEAFLNFLDEDPRIMNDAEVAEAYADFKRKWVCECGMVAEDEDKLRTDGQRFICEFCMTKVKP